MKPAILFFVSEDWYFCSHRLPIARAARDNGFKVIVLTKVGEHRQEIEDEGFELVPIRLERKRKDILREVRTIIDVIRVYYKKKPDIVHHVAIKPILYGSIAARFAGIPSIVNALAGLGVLFVGDGIKGTLSRWLATAAYRVAFSRVNTFGLFQNPQDLDLFVKNRIVSKNRCTVIRGSGVDPHQFKYQREPNTEPVILMASRMIWHKGVGIFIEALKQLRTDGVNLNAWLVGGPDEHNPASIPEETLRRWDEEGVVSWLGYREDMPELLASSHIVALPTSYGEGVPKVLIEAAASGKAIIATDTPGCREIVKHNQNGLLVPPNDSKALAAAIKALIDNPRQRKNMGRVGRNIFIDGFTTDHVADETLDLYKRLVKFA